jgi:hypothetical protein
MRPGGAVALRIVGQTGWVDDLVPGSESGCEFVERDADPNMRGEVGGELVVTTS